MALEKTKFKQHPFPFSPSFEAYPGFGAWYQEKLRGVMCGKLVMWL